MEPLNIHINLTTWEFAALANGELPWVNRIANPSRIQTVFLYGPDGNHRKPRRIPASAASALADDPQALSLALTSGKLIPRGRKVVFHKAYSSIIREVSLQGLGLLLSDIAVIHLEVCEQTLRSSGIRDARCVEVLDRDTLTDAAGNDIGKIRINSLGSAFITNLHTIPLEVLDRRKYFVKL